MLQPGPIGRYMLEYSEYSEFSTFHSISYDLRLKSPFRVLLGIQSHNGIYVVCFPTLFRQGLQLFDLFYQIRLLVVKLFVLGPIIVEF